MRYSSASLWWISLVFRVRYIS